MDKYIDRQINKKFLIPQPSSCNNRLKYKISQPAATKTKNNKEGNNESNIIDYKNISLSMTGEISSSFIHRNSLTQRQRNVTSMVDTEDDDEQFILNMKTMIDKNYKMQNKENFSIKDLQSKSYLLRKKKCAFNDEDQNLMKRFKKSLDKSKILCVAPQSEQQSVFDHNCSTALQITPATVKYNATDTNFRINIHSYVHDEKGGTNLLTDRKTD
ncbi:uncharacterized protein LOC105205477 isoform X2 [Solenopsis invicta]|uniref:uncharacterized protein LOC105205477 isoform X2 n=1 Tax=Solenopsis invicta TaxID=13686 RepID=UPI00193D9FE4|nr:uncharacterized protein LOC105205477 isoform X2 [Solenopsis invicta]